ncbi:MAG: hypothetical protein HRT86_01475 [Ilumatobacteraceae bacterium]|nr:hypothetical protein [Ilumatobacteraceae bacterium]
MTMPRLLAIMGSGETAPTMKAPHRAIFERLEAAKGGDVSAVLLDTPFGFQENAPILAEKAVEYFRESIGRRVEAAGLTSTTNGDLVAVERAIAAIRNADWLFAGPGSPTYALAQWRDTPVPDALADRLTDGGALVFSSAAALTLGVATVPVYEIYKVGEPPRWEQGLDLLGPLGLSVAVIPHYDNAEGGNHDTRFCYLGERRLAMLEPELPDGTHVLGVDEHTGVIIDLDTDTAEIVGKGAVTIRRHGESTRIEAGTTVSVDVLRGTTTSAPMAVGSTPDAAGTSDADERVDDTPESTGYTSLAARATELEDQFAEALDRRDADGAVEAILLLEATIVEWSRDTFQSDELDRARRALRSMIVRLGSAATEGVRDVREVLGPVVEAALTARAVARAEKAFAVSDAIRDGLIDAGIEVRDTPDGVEWDPR